MTEQEALRMLYAILTCMELDDHRSIGKGCSGNCDECLYNYAKGIRGEQEEVLDVAAKALVEIQQYRTLGTLEELRALKAKQIPKEPYIWIDGCDGYEELGENIVHNMYDCPNCGKSCEIDGKKYDFCPECGQALDWSGVSGTD